MTGPVLSRRSFLGTGAALGLTVAFTPGCTLPIIPKRPEPEIGEAGGWIRFDGEVYTLTLPRNEIGQNISTALKQIACEELGVGWTEVRVEAHNTKGIERVKSTVGSESVKDYAEPLAQACATLRDAVQAGKTQTDITATSRPRSELRIFRPGARFIGASPRLEHSRALVTGEPLFASDMRREAMIYGRVIRAPSAPDLSSSPQGWNLEAARADQGFIALVEDDRLLHVNSQGLGILARTPGALDRIEQALAVEWEMETPDPASLPAALDIDDRLANGTLDNTLIDNGPIKENGAEVDIRIDLPAAAHNAIEPRVALASEEDGCLHLWTGSQDVFYVRDVLSKKLSLDEEEVCVHACRVGGGFGGKTLCFVELEAAILSRAAGKPVKVQWTRAQEYAQAFHRPPTSHRIRASVSKDRVDHWHHAFSSGHVLFTNAVAPAWLHAATNLIGDKGVARGATPPYAFGATRVEYDLERLPLLTGPWRGLGAGPNAMAMEMAMNECALAAGIDPIEYRLKQLKDPRLAATLREASNQAGWIPGQTRGRGVACGIYKEMSYATVIADVKETGDGGYHVTDMWCVHDCGQVINPDQVAAQCEGNLVWGLGMVFHDNLVFEGNNVTAELFSDAPSPRMTDCPDLHIHLIDSGEQPVGAGETAIVASGAAIANAIRTLRPAPLSRFPLGQDGGTYG